MPCLYAFFRFQLLPNFGGFKKIAKGTCCLGVLFYSCTALFAQTNDSPVVKSWPYHPADSAIHALDVSGNWQRLTAEELYRVWAKLNSLTDTSYIGLSMNEVSYPDSVQYWLSGMSIDGQSYFIHLLMKERGKYALREKWYICPPRVDKPCSPRFHKKVVGCGIPLVPGKCSRDDCRRTSGLSWPLEGAFSPD